MTITPDLSTIPGARAAMDRVEERLRELATLDADWDSYGAAALAPRALASARRLVADVLWHAGQIGPGTLPLRVEAMPLAAGGVQLELGGRGGCLDIEVMPDDTLNFLLMPGAGEASTWIEREKVGLAEVLGAVGRIVGAARDGE